MRDQATLILGGDHAAAAWLAPYLARRGLAMAWAEAGASEREPCWGVSAQLFVALGEQVPSWPLEVCAMQIDGLARYQDGSLVGLDAWPVTLLAPADLRRELATELAQLGVPRLPALPARAPADGWLLEIAYAPCEADCQGLVCTGLLQGQSLPAGLIEVHQAGDLRLSLAALSPGQAAFSCEAEAGGESAIWDLLAQALDRSPRSLNRRPLAWRAQCRCLPRLQREDRLLRLLLPPETLLPESQWLQATAWLCAFALGRWLSTEFGALDRLGSDLEDYVAKVLVRLVSLGKSHKFLQIRS